MSQSLLNVVGIDHAVLYVSDLDASRRFYKEVLGFDERAGSGGDRIAFMVCGNQGIDLIATEAGASAGGGPGGGSELHHLALRLASGTRDQIVAALSSIGIETHAREQDPETVYLLDPDGHRIQLLSEKEQEKNRRRFEERRFAASQT
jgi:catechol 2,3-dioxygenase-like lactoylglutathione lyase family enzyme